MKIFKSKSGEISPQPIWVCFYSCYMHTSDSLLKLIWEVIVEYKHDDHLVG